MVVSQTFHVEAPLEVVFDYFKDPTKWGAAALMDVRDVNVTRDGMGTNFAWEVKVGPLRLDGFEVLTEVVPNERIRERSSWSVFGKWLYTFAPEGRGTRVTIEVQPQSLWALPPLNRLAGMAISRMGRASMPRFIAAIEREAAAAPARRTAPRKPAAS